MSRAPWITLLGLLATGCSPKTDEALPPEEPRAVQTLLQARPGERVTNAGVAVIAPMADFRVFAEVVLDSGETKTLHLRTDGQGKVYSISDGMFDDAAYAGEAADEPTVVSGDAASEDAVASAPDPCADTGRNLLPFAWSSATQWSFTDANTPPSNDASKVEAKLQSASTNIATSQNSCGLSDRVGATALYAGRSAEDVVQIAADGSCLDATDGTSGVSFGELPSGVLAVLCLRYDASAVALEADVRLNQTDHTFYAVKPGNCTDRFDLEAVMTHLFGHVFGLGHLVEPTHGNLTMSQRLNGPCQGAESTLGRGDVIGLRAKYGKSP